jgi:hypothetical protein
MLGIFFWHMDGCNMDDLFAFAYYYDTLEEWEEKQEEHRQFGEQMDRAWKLAKEWNLPPQYSEPSPEFDDVWRLVVIENNGEIPLGTRLNRVAHEVVSIIVQLRIAAEQHPGLAVERYCESLQLAFAQLQRACEASNSEGVSPDVEPSVTHLMNSVDALISDVEGYANADSAADDNEEAACETIEPETAAASRTSASQQPPRAPYWGRVLHFSQELRSKLRVLTAPIHRMPLLSLSGKRISR